MKAMILGLVLGCALAPTAKLHAGNDSSDETHPALRELTSLTLHPDSVQPDAGLYRGVSLGAFQDDEGAQGAAGAEPPAGDAPPPQGFDDIWTRKQLSGDWWGVRSGLADYGIDIQLRLSQYYQAVVSGGVNTNDEYGATMDYRLNADLHKLGLWEGFSFNVHARSRWGRDVSADAGALVLENAGLLMPLPGDYQGTNVTGLTVTQMLPFFNEQPLAVSFGKLDVIDLVTMFFPNLAYGQEGFWNVNAMVTALPWFGAVRGLSLYGGYATTINPKYMAPETGILVTGTENVTTSWSMTKSFEDGVFLAGWHRFYWDLDDKMGFFMIFAGGSTRSQPSNDPLDHINLPGPGIVSTEEKKPWNIAFYVYQDFWQAEGDPNRKANFLIGGTVGPDNPQFAQWNVFGNVEAFGVFPSRPHDRMGVGVWWNGLSDNYKDLVSPVADLTDLWGVELYYNFEVVPWFRVTPDIQIVQNEWSNDDVAVILGVRGVLDF